MAVSLAKTLCINKKFICIFRRKQVFPLNGLNKIHTKHH